MGGGRDKILSKSVTTKEVGVKICYFLRHVFYGSYPNVLEHRLEQ